MSRYVAHLKNRGEGCDYTVGCGEKLVDLKATDLEAAKEECLQIYRDHGAASGDPPIVSIRIFEMQMSIDIDLRAFDEERRRRREADRQKQIEAHERAELARLRAKYDGGKL